MLDMTPCRSFLHSTGYNFSQLRIPTLEMGRDLRDLLNIAGGQVGRNNLNLLFLPCAYVDNAVQMGIRSLSQRDSLDTHQYKIRDAKNYLDGYYNNTTAVFFVNFKSINAENRAALKEFVTAEYENAQVVNSRYMVLHPQCDVAVYKFPNNKFLVLTNTMSLEFLEAVYAMLWINHDHTTATPEMADALLRGDEDTIIGYINSLIVARVEGMAARKFNFFTDTFKGIMVQRNRTATLENQLQSIRNEIDRLNAKLLEQFTKRKSTLGKLLAIQNETQDNTLDDLLLMIKPEDITSVNESDSTHSQLYFTIKSRFTYWDVDDYKIMRDRRTRNNNFLTRFNDTFIGFLDEIFVNKTYTLIFNTPLVLYTYETNGGAVPCISRGNQRDVTGFVSNPHIYHYNCWGDNGGLIAGAFESGDFITGWGTIISALSAVSMSDTPVMTRFTNDLYDYAIHGSGVDAKQIIKGDGTALSIKAAYDEYCQTHA